ncbi:MAG: hypothetical protein RI894_1655 [Bacteroidota bacterium]|jgi:hypothetical protein
MDFLPNSLQQALNDKREFRLGDYLEQGFNIAKQNFGGFIGYMFVYGFILMALMITIIGAIPALLIAPAFAVGHLLVAHKIHNKELYEFKDFFGGFTHWKELLFVAFLTGILAIMATLPYYYYNLGGLDIQGLITALSAKKPDMNAFSEIIKTNSENTSVLVSYLLQLPIYAISALFQFAPFLVIFFNLSATNAMRTSFNLGLKYFWWLILMNVLLGFFAALGLILCFVGIFFTITIVMCTQYAMMAHLTGLNDEKEADITQHFVTE